MGAEHMGPSNELRHNCPVSEARECVHYKPVKEPSALVFNRNMGDPDWDVMFVRLWPKKDSLFALGGICQMGHRMKGPEPK